MKPARLYAWGARGPGAAPCASAAARCVPRAAPGRLLPRDRLRLAPGTAQPPRWRVVPRPPHAAAQPQAPGPGSRGLSPAGRRGKHAVTTAARPEGCSRALGRSPAPRLRPRSRGGAGKPEPCPGGAPSPSPASPSWSHSCCEMNRWAGAEAPLCEVTSGLKLPSAPQPNFIYDQHHHYVTADPSAGLRAPIRAPALRGSGSAFQPHPYAHPRNAILIRAGEKPRRAAAQKGTEMPRATAAPRARRDSHKAHPLRLTLGSGAGGGCWVTPRALGAYLCPRG